MDEPLGYSKSERLKGGDESQITIIAGVIIASRILCYMALK